MFYVQFSKKIVLFMENVGKYGRARHVTDDSITWRMRFASWVNKAIDTHPEGIIHIGFPHQKWLHESASVLRNSIVPVFIWFI